MTKLQLLADDIIRDDSMEAISGNRSTSGQSMMPENTSRTMATPIVNSTRQHAEYDGESLNSLNGLARASEDHAMTTEKSSGRQVILSAFSTTPMMSSTDSTSSSVEQNMFLKLQRRRLHNERLRNSLEQEIQNHMSLQKEEESLRQKISRAHDVIGSLKDQSESLEATYKSMEELYRTNTEKLKILQQAVRDVHERIEKDTKQFNLYTSQLRKLHQQLPELTRELAEAADTNTAISQSLIQKVTISRNATETRGSLSQGNIDATVQTNCDMDTIREIESIRKQLAMQRGIMKQARETVDLIRRCS
jgi:chromosome segregation ATPase